MAGRDGFAHTPWDGSDPAFRIGLRPLDLADWLEVDDQLEFYLDQKARLITGHGDGVFLAEERTEAVQAEALALISEHLAKRHPAIYRRDGSAMRIGTRRLVRLDDPHRPPLAIAAALVQEDLVVMRRGEDGWRLAAASLCFPSSWSLKAKFGKRLDEIHRPVPGFGPGSRNASLMARIFENLSADRPVFRLNWSVYEDDALYHGERTSEGRAPWTPQMAASAFVRVEYQTLRRLPVCDAILFTIRIYRDPLTAIAAAPDRERLLAGLIGSLNSLDADQLAYKGLTSGRNLLVGHLESLLANVTGSGPRKR
jgi:hypothetical protein